MAYPVVETSVIGGSVSADTIHTVSLPAGYAVGDLLIAGIQCDGITTSANIVTWRPTAASASGGTSMYIYSRIVDGTEAASIDIDLSDSVHARWWIFRISGAFIWNGDESHTTGSDSNPDPPSLTPASGSGDILWIATAGFGVSTLTSYPASYTDNQLTSTGSAVGIAVATRNRAAASEDPGAFALDAGFDWNAITLAVYGRPGSGGGGGGTSGWHGGSGDCNCGCVTTPCGGCQPETITISISGATNPDCTGCAGLNGTYVLADRAQMGCLWNNAFGYRYNCNFEDASNFIVIGSPPSQCFSIADRDGLAIEIKEASGGGIDLKIYISKVYSNALPPPPYSASPQSATEHISVFKEHFSNCGDIVGAVIPFLENNSIDLEVIHTYCLGYLTTPAGPGDYCNLDGATVTILSVT